MPNPQAPGRLELDAGDRSRRFPWSASSDRIGTSARDPPCSRCFLA